MFADVNGARICYDDVGEGEPVLLIGGFGANRHFWSRAVEQLEGFRVVTYDNRGVGETEYSGPFTIDDMADDAVALMDHLGIGRAHVLGWSMGSHIGQSLGIRHGDRLKSLTLVSTYLRRPARSAYVLGSLAGMAMEGRAPVECLAIAVNALCFTEQTFLDLEARGRKMPVPKKLEEPAGMIDQLQAIDVYDTTDSVSSISVPTMVVHGGMDIMVEPREGERVARSIGGSRFLLLPSEGHNIPFESYSAEFRAFVDAQK